MIATILLGVCLTGAGADGPPKLEDLRASSRGEAVAGTGAEARRRRAPEHEAAGKTGGRPEHRGLAPTVNPDEVTKRGLLGLVRYRDEWVEPDAVAARVRADADQAAALDEYHVRRDRTPDTSVAQTALADWCEHRGLKAEAIAHVTAVTRLDPNNKDYEQALDHQESVDRKNRKFSSALRELTGQTIADPDPVRARETWREWWADKQGYPYSPGAPRRIETVDQVEHTVIYWLRRSCFAAGTPVRTLLGMRPIESIQVGDQVLAQDLTTGALSFESVLALHHNPPKPTLRIDLGDEALVATPIHRFWKAGQGWAMARDLKPGDTIRRLGGTAQVVSVSEEKVQPVFNLDVAHSRSFFVGASGALVHDNSLVDPVLRPFDSPQAPPAEGPLEGRESVADGARTVGGRSLLPRATPLQPSELPCPGA